MITGYSCAHLASFHWCCSVVIHLVGIRLVLVGGSDVEMLFKTVLSFGW